MSLDWHDLTWIISWAFSRLLGCRAKPVWWHSRSVFEQNWPYSYSHPIVIFYNRRKKRKLSMCSFIWFNSILRFELRDQDMLFPALALGWDDKWMNNRWRLQNFYCTSPCSSTQSLCRSRQEFKSVMSPVVGGRLSVRFNTKWKRQIHLLTRLGLIGDIP